MGGSERDVTKLFGQVLYSDFTSIYHVKYGLTCCWINLAAGLTLLKKRPDICCLINLAEETARHMLLD